MIGVWPTLFTFLTVRAARRAWKHCSTLEEKGRLILYALTPFFSFAFLFGSWFWGLISWVLAAERVSESATAEFSPLVIDIVFVQNILALVGMMLLWLVISLHCLDTIKKIGKVKK